MLRCASSLVVATYNLKVTREKVGLTPLDLRALPPEPFAALSNNLIDRLKVKEKYISLPSALSLQPKGLFSWKWAYWGFPRAGRAPFLK